MSRMHVDVNSCHLKKQIKKKLGVINEQKKKNYERRALPMIGPANFFIFIMLSCDFFSNNKIPHESHVSVLMVTEVKEE